MDLEDDHYCFGCGSLNDSGLKLKFDLDKEKKIITTEFTPQKIYQGFKNIVHGGIIGLVLDECMVNLLWKLGIPAVSAEFNVRLIKPAHINKKLIFRAYIVSSKKNLLMVDGECLDEKGKPVATSSSKCVKIKEV
ncbi:MAG: PaaI family thioesterase [Candidatus Omnitrophota bacterium]